jgi:hypothetical protein
MVAIRLRRIMLAALIAAGVSAWGSTGVRAGANVLHLTTDISVFNPCNSSEQVSGTLRILLVVNRQSAGEDSVHVNVHASAQGRLASAQNTYQLSGEGDAQFDNVANFYDVPFHANVPSSGSAANLKLDGVARVFVDSAGDPVGGIVVSVTPTCG